jgi:hypothetical protein
VNNGISLRFPIGPLPLAGRAMAAEAATRTLGRDAGQRLDQPLGLYELTGPAGLGRMAGSWGRLME